MNELLTLLKDRFEYRDGGLYVRRVYHNGIRAGSRAGTVLTDGYRQVRVAGKQYREHHLVWLWHFGVVPVELDHINCVRDDNRIENLRECSRAQNMQNRKFAMAQNKSGLIGASKHWNRYRASIVTNGRKIHLGVFATAREASAAYLAARAHGITGAQE